MFVLYYSIGNIAIIAFPVCSSLTIPFRKTSVTGTLFGVGTLLSIIFVTLVTCTKIGKKVIDKIAQSPFDLCFSMAGITVGTLLVIVPNLFICVIGIILFFSFFNLSVTLITELQASITTVSNYRSLGPAGQVSRHVFKIIGSFLGPFLLAINPLLPYIMSSCVAFLWTVLLFVSFKLRMK